MVYIPSLPYTLLQLYWSDLVAQENHFPLSHLRHTVIVQSLLAIQDFPQYQPCMTLLAISPTVHHSITQPKWPVSTSHPIQRTNRCGTQSPVVGAWTTILQAPATLLHVNYHCCKVFPSIINSETWGRRDRLVTLTLPSWHRPSSIGLGGGWRRLMVWRNLYDHGIT